MPRHISILFPGQGSQSLGMLNHHSTDLLKSYEEEINNLLGFNIIDVINNGPIEDLNKTSITQPAILLASILDFKNISNKLGLIPDLLCGHSLGEYSAMVAANAISLQEGLSLVHKRGKLMEKCPKGSMCAVLNVDLDVINEICSKVEDEIKTIVTPANLNSPKQIVVSGTEEGVDEVINRLKDCGYKKCIKLKVSVAAHSKVMNNTLDQFENELNKINFSLPEYSIIQNVNNKIPKNIDNLKENLLSQLVMPVQWVNTMKQIKKYDGIVIECGPNKVLSGLAKANGIENVYSTSSEDFFDKIKKEL